jgi:DNA-binding transcriptional MerR regulator
MPIKMKQLMEETGESKSTILFYVKEGLLPEPQKPKPNLHLYDESSINTIKFIKYMQNQFSYSIAQIKAIFSENRFDFNSDFSMLLKSLQMMSGEFGAKWYNQEDFLELSELRPNELNEYLQRGWLFKQEQGFSTQELKLVQLFKDASTMGLDTRLFDAYVKSARTLAKIEYEIGAIMLEEEERENSEHYKVLFDSILILKPYLFNMHTIKEHQQQMERKK